ncbi:MAG: hypothetical protein IJS55_00335 [Oscillospiraceae bacterium]|nr:hypothetical protein [Oscillospiraceae bacterium]MBR0211738.1 hypothetical protein [Oscillospiraceae bacterium]
MNGLEKINQRIRRDGSDEVAAIRAEAEGRVRSIRADYRAQIAQLEADASARRSQAVAERLERLGGSADMERRQMLLAAKQSCIDEAFARAARALENLPRQDYVALLARLAAENGSGDEELVLSAADRDAVGPAVVAAANALKPGAAFTLSAESRDLGGGVVLKRGPVEVNCTFDTRLRQLRQEMATDVAQILFA